MRWIGIDLGTQAVGFAVVEGTQQNYVLTHWDVLRVARAPLPHRMNAIYTWLSQKVEKWTPFQAVGIEEPFVGRNVRSALLLGTVKGLVWALLLQRGFEAPVTLSPSEVKRAITGRAHASKEQVSGMLSHHLHLPPSPPADPDAVDAAAIALAVAYAQNSPMILRLTKRADK
ncbi:MAG: crossover junction endodeoxyribonuclease RuvC [Bacteroidia bacterium]|nr:crossover junction endodeoxyribonuclease RuvC [Bacteroidia bacterium]MDW8015669.1 crossover junction endodeoxyribonuclease RuvC [Bacteroidia bacterium]